MPRNYKSTEVFLKPDPRYGSELASKIINKLMLKGKMSVAQRLLYEAVDIVAKKTEKEPLEIFDQAMRNVSPSVEVKPRRVGGATYQVPIEVSGSRRTALAMRWLIRGARARAGMPMRARLAQELLDASRGQGSAVRRREELYRMAEANRAFSHYRW